MSQTGVYRYLDGDGKEKVTVCNYPKICKSETPESPKAKFKSKIWFDSNFSSENLKYKKSKSKNSPTNSSKQISEYICGTSGTYSPKFYKKQKTKFNVKSER